MEATITTLEDVFKRKVKDSIGVPTIWVDYDGTSHEDYECQIVEVIPLIVRRANSTTGFARVDDSFSFRSTDSSENTEVPKLLAIEGYVTQVGSHVIEARTLINIDFKTYDISNVFKYATNLRAAVSCFRALTSLTEIPEDLFWNCPKLEIARSVFANTQIASVPENLLIKNPLLTEVDSLFCGCKNLRTAPPKLFSNNTNLTSYLGLFKCSGISEVPFELLDNVRGSSMTPDFSYMFLECKKLKSLPDGFFRDFPKGTEFTQSIIDTPISKFFKIGRGINARYDYEQIKKILYPDWLDGIALENVVSPY